MSEGIMGVSNCVFGGDEWLRERMFWQELVKQEHLCDGGEDGTMGWGG